MTDNGDLLSTDEETPEPQPAGQSEAEPIGGEIRVTGGGSPRWLRWFIYSLHVWAIIYLVVHPTVANREIILVFAGLITVWLLFFALTKRPPEL